jgi:hypothetical protein
VRRRVVELLGPSRDDRLAAVAVGLLGIAVVWLALRRIGLPEWRWGSSSR